MMSVADPTFTAPAHQAYTIESVIHQFPPIGADQNRRSQRMMTESQLNSQWNKQESQFMRMTGNVVSISDPSPNFTAKYQTQGGDLNSTTTRFWLALVPEQAAQLLHQFLVSELGETQVQVQSLPDKIIMYVQKAAGQKTVEGSFVIRSNDSIQAEGQTLIVMYRRKVSLLTPSCLKRC